MRTPDLGLSTCQVLTKDTFQGSPALIIRQVLPWQVHRDLPGTLKRVKGPSIVLTLSQETA